MDRKLPAFLFSVSILVIGAASALAEQLPPFRALSVPVRLTDNTIGQQVVPGPDVQGSGFRNLVIPEPSAGAMAEDGTMLGRELRVTQPLVPAPPTPRQKTPNNVLAPVLISSFDTIDFFTDALNDGFYHIPPDPSGAVGTGHAVCVVNSSIQWYTKAGVSQNNQRLGRNGGGSIVGSFFAAQVPANTLFDPKVIYDQYADRFVVVALERVDDGDAPSAGDPGDFSRILVAVSDDGDPNGTWYTTAINSKIVIGGVDRWMDYPGFAVDNLAVYISGNMFSFGGAPGYGGSRLWIIDKGLIAGFYAGFAAAVSVNDPGTAAGIGSAPTMQPAHMFGVPPATYGTFLVSSGWQDGALNDALSVIKVTSPVAAPAFANDFVGLGGNIFNPAVALPTAPQSGTATTVATGDVRALNAVWRNNELWTMMTINPFAGANSGQATAYWVRMGADGVLATSLTDVGEIGGDDIAAGTYTFHASVAVDALGNAAFTYAASAPTIFPGAYFSGRLSGDPAGTNQGSAVLRAGLDYYIRTFGAGSNRWGDYSATSIDPTDDSFWVFHEYAIARGNPTGAEDGQWRTAFGHFSAASLPVSLSRFKIE